jgi:hypothetical protein
VTENPTAPAAGSPGPDGEAGTAATDARDAKPRTARENVGKVWLRRVVIAAAVLIVAMAIYLVLAAFVPRWWAQSVGRQVDGRLSRGIWLGLIYGTVFTFLPLLLLAQVGRRALGWKVKIGLVVAAILLAIPNLMTLSIAVGSSRASQAGDRILDVEAPGFRYATLWGVGLGVLLGLIVVAVVIVFERRGDELKVLRARVEQLEAELEAVRPPLQTLLAQPAPTDTSPAQPAPVEPDQP